MLYASDRKGFLVVPYLIVREVGLINVTEDTAIVLFNEGRCRMRTLSDEQTHLVFVIWFAQAAITQQRVDPQGLGLK